MPSISLGSRDRLIAQARDMLQRLRSQEIEKADRVMALDASIYHGEDHFQREKDRIFRKLPLMLAASCELPSAGSYKTLEVAGIPLLLTRDQNGQAHAFLNSCTHRGAQLTGEACGTASRFTCPYHGWTFKNNGALMGIASREQFGELSADASLVHYPVYESAGLIWVTLDQTTDINAEDFLQGFDQLIAGFGLESWELYHQVSLDGANWKLAFDAHMDFYHLPVLHRETFGPEISNMAQYYFCGPHQRLGLMSENTVEQDSLTNLQGLPEDQWPLESLLFGEWIIFPNTSLNCFQAGVRVMVISQILPGKSAEHSRTIQTFLVEAQPSETERPQVDQLVGFIQKVVGEEDLPMSYRQQQALSSGELKTVLLGRNEVGLQQYHQALTKYLNRQ